MKANASDLLKKIIEGELAYGGLNLTDREQHVIFKRLFTPTTLESMAKEMHATRERVRQIEQKALKKIDNHFKAIEERSKANAELPKPKNVDKSMKIDALDLSVRSYNCLRRYGIQYVYELIEFRKEDLIKIRNLGVKSANEIKLRVRSLGLRFKDEA